MTYIDPATGETRRDRRRQNKAVKVERRKQADAEAERVRLDLIIDEVLAEAAERIHRHVPSRP